ncbi:DUF1801 domain-containing protein [Filobacillus milosensis]|uniref:DUF1801 domain-containing protein n=1 Tax=Filobacillus milosensis TaxID=94137 RepID=A0A4Y8IQL9_9BACI|nr:DUF1801 domain-containing protein [Filobacillus milosensis]TFB22830.1 DUF1801 domain-containing protein [Filobacillus milosensis]
MYELKTKQNDDSVIEFIENVESPKKREDAFKLLDIFTETTGYEAKMWGTSIIGFGAYKYKYESGHGGEFMLAGFSPRKAKFSLYLMSGTDELRDLLEQFGKHKTGKSCIYLNKLDDIDEDVLKQMIQRSVELMKNNHQIIE